LIHNAIFFVAFVGRSIDALEVRLREQTPRRLEYQLSAPAEPTGFRKRQIYPLKEAVTQAKSQFDICLSLNK
jgi:hypothetical protein